MPDDFIDELERLGEKEVRRKLAAGEYGSKGYDYQRVEVWLAGEAEARGETTTRQLIEIARSAKNAAWWAIGISIIALAVGAIGAVPVIRSLFVS